MVLLVNFIHFLLTTGNILQSQNFSTEHPIKGDIIDFHLLLENRLPFISTNIELIFHDNLNLQVVNKILKGHGKYSIDSSFTLKYKGIYNVGCKSATCLDFLGVFSKKLNIWDRTFYVYPRIQKNLINNFSGSGNNDTSLFTKPGLTKDYFNSLLEYRDGSSFSHISWKHFAATGKPYVKEFFSQESSNLSIFIDDTIVSLNRAESCEDLCTEVAVSLIHNNLNLCRTVKVSNFHREINNSLDFNEYYKNTITYTFNKSESQMINSFNNRYLKNDKIVVISPLESTFFLDPKILNYYENLELFLITSDIKMELLNQIKESLENNNHLRRVTWLE